MLLLLLGSADCVCCVQIALSAVLTPTSRDHSAGPLRAPAVLYHPSQAFDYVIGQCVILQPLT